MSAMPFSFPVFKAFTQTGTLAPLVGGKLYAFAAGTSTPLATYSDAALTTPNAHPVVLDANGEAIIYLGAAPYKMRLENSASVVQTGWPIDNIQSSVAISALYTDALRSDLADASDIDNGDAKIAVEQPFTGAVARTQHDKNKECISVLDFGADPTGVADSTVYFQAASDSITTPGSLLIPAGTYKVQGWIITNSDLNIICHGSLIPAANTTTPVVQLGTDAIVCFRVTGNLSTTSGGLWSTWTNAIGISFKGLVEANLLLNVNGFNVGLDFCPAATAVAYNSFYLQRVYNNATGIYMRPTSTGYTNEMHFFGGRFAHTGTTNLASLTHINHESEGANIVNNIHYYCPCFEGGAKMINWDSIFCSVRQARGEIYKAGTQAVDYAQPYIDFHSRSKNNIIEFGYISAMQTAGGGMGVDLGVATRVNNYSATVSGNQTLYCYPGALVHITVGGVTFASVITSSAYGAPSTTIRITDPIITGNSTATVVPSVVNSANWPGNSVRFTRLQIPGENVYTFYKDERRTYSRSSITISNMDSHSPALVLVPGGAGAEDVLRVIEFDSLSANLTGTGQLYLKDKLLTTGGIGVGNSAAGTTPSGCVKKIQVFDAAGASLGYLAVYSAIT